MLVAIALVFLACPPSGDDPGRDWLDGFTQEDGSPLVLAPGEDDSPFLLVFWSTWSTPCRPLLDGLSDLGDGVTVLAVRVGDAERGAPVPEGMRLVLPAAEEVVAALDVRVLPTTLVVDGRGAVLHRFEGYSPEVVGRIRRAIEEVKAEDEGNGQGDG